VTTTLDMDTQLKVIGLVCAELEGRDPLQYVLAMNGPECVSAHNVLKKLDDLLKAQWKLMGSPQEQPIL
jgi:hypothetical protein